MSRRGQQSLSGQNRARFGCVKGGLYTGQVCKKKISSILQTHNSAYTRFCQEPNLSRAGLLGVRRGVGAGQSLGKVQGVATFPEPHKSVCSRLFSDFGSMEPPRVERMGYWESGKRG